MFSLNGSVLSGKTTLGTRGVGFWPFLDDDEEFLYDAEKQKKLGTQDGFIACGPGYRADYNPVTNSSKCVPEDPSVKVYVDGKEVNPSTNLDGCSPGTKFVRRNDGTGTCVAVSTVTTVSQTWGQQTTIPGGDTYNQKGSTTCPAGTYWDPAKGQCGKGTCPAGTILDKINGTCDKVAGGGGTSASKPAPAPPAPAPVEPPPSMMAGISPMMIVAGVLGFAALGAVVYKVRKDRAAKGGMSPNEYDEVYLCTETLLDLGRSGGTFSGQRKVP
jgi:hypothetical protein